MTTHGYVPEPPERGWAILALTISLIVLVAAFFGAGWWFIELLAGPEGDALYQPQSNATDFIIGLCLVFAMLYIVLAIRLSAELLGLELTRLWKRLRRKP